MTLMYALQAAVLDRRLYQIVTEEREWFSRALSVVFTSAVAFGIGVRFITPADRDMEGMPGWIGAIGFQNAQMLLGISTIFLSWIMWSVIAYYVGSKLLRGEASYKITIRSIGMAYGPASLALLIFWRLDIILLVMLWVLASGAVAIKETQKFGWFKSFIPVMFGWLFAWPFLFINIVLPLFLAPSP